MREILESFSLTTNTPLSPETYQDIGTGTATKGWEIFPFMSYRQASIAGTPFPLPAAESPHTYTTGLLEYGGPTNPLIVRCVTGDPDIGTPSLTLNLLPADIPLEPDLAKLLQIPIPAKPQPVPAPNIDAGPGGRPNNNSLVALERFILGELTLMVCNGVLYEYVSPCWRILNDKGAETRIRKVLQGYHLTQSLTTREYREIRGLLLCNPDIQRETLPSPPQHLLNLSDGTLDLRTMELLPHCPNDGFFTALDLSYEEIFDCSGGEAFERFASNVSNGDSSVRQQLLELVALAITGYEAKAFYVLLGPSNTGKTQFGRFLGELVGRDHVASVAGVHDFANRFSTSALAGKRLALCLDLPDAPLPSIAVGIIKQLVGDDSIKVEAKYKDSKTVYEKPLLLFAGNHPIRIPNIAQEGALINRMITIPFSNPVAEEGMQQQFYKALLAEAPYIVSCAIEAYRNLMQRNFALTRSALPTNYSPQDAREGVQAVEVFLLTQCAYDEGSETSTDCLYQAYDIFAMEQGFPALPKVDFGRLLSVALRQSTAKIIPLKRCGGKDVRGYRGVRLRTEEPWSEAQ